MNGLINQVTDVWLAGWVSPSIKKILLFFLLFFHLVFGFLKTLSLPVLTAVTSPSYHCRFGCAGSKTASNEVFKPAVIVCREVV